MGISIGLSSLQNSVTKRSDFIIILMFIVMFLLIYLKRMIGSDSDFILLAVTVCFVVIMAVVIGSTFTQVLKEGHRAHPRADTFAYIFNSPASKNFIAIMALILFIIFVYEIPEYENSKPHNVVDAMLFGNNSLISNRTMGVILLVMFSLFSGYVIYATTIEFEDGVTKSAKLSDSD